MLDCGSVESVGTADLSVEHVADVAVDVAGMVDGVINGVPLAVVAVVEFAGVLAVVVAVAAVVAAAVYAVDAKSADVATVADFELGVLDGIPDYPAL